MICQLQFLGACKPCQSLIDSSDAVDSSDGCLETSRRALLLSGSALALLPLSNVLPAVAQEPSVCYLSPEQQTAVQQVLANLASKPKVELSLVIMYSQHWALAERLNGHSVTGTRLTGAYPAATSFSRCWHILCCRWHRRS